MGTVRGEKLVASGDDGQIWDGYNIPENSNDPEERVAIKVFDSKKAARAIDTAFLLDQIDSPSVIELRAYFRTSHFVKSPEGGNWSPESDNAESFLVFPFGIEDLDQLVRSKGRQHPRVFKHALRGLRDTHVAGIAHLDFKLANVMHMSRDEFRLIDYEYAIKVKEDSSVDKLPSYGTIGFMAPGKFLREVSFITTRATAHHARVEIIRNLPFNPQKADVFSAALALLYFLRARLFKFELLRYLYWQASVEWVPDFLDKTRDYSQPGKVDLDAQFIRENILAKVKPRLSAGEEELLSKGLCKEDQRFTLEEFYQEYCQLYELPV